MLPLTCEEVFQHQTQAQGSRVTDCGSVFDQGWPQCNWPGLSADDVELVETIRRLRTATQQVLEVARRAGTIGRAEEAHVTYTILSQDADDALLTMLRGNSEVVRLVAQASSVTVETGGVATSEGHQQAFDADYESVSDNGKGM